MSGMNKILGLKEFKIQKTLGRKIFLVRKIFGLKNTGTDKILGLKNFESMKILSPKKLWIQNNSGSKKLLDSKLFRVLKFFRSENFCINQINFHLRSYQAEHFRSKFCFSWYKELQQLQQLLNKAQQSWAIKVILHWVENIKLSEK